MDSASRPRIIVVCGPTASGKSEAGLYLAKRLSGEIVNADSRQVYRYMDIGTAKPSLEERGQVPHHLFDIVRPDEPFTLALYLAEARRAIDEIVARRALPIVVGGTGLYTRALVRGFTPPLVAPNGLLRADLERLFDKEGLEGLQERLRRAQLAGSAGIDVRNPRRLMRAIEVAESDQTEPFDGAKTLGYPALEVRLTAERSLLYSRADRRVDTMIAAGFVDEVRRLYRSGYGPNLPALSGLGYRELGTHLSGDSLLDEAVAATKDATHRYIRRQVTWYRGDSEQVEVDICNRDWLEATVRRAEEWLVSGQSMSPSGPDA